MKSANEKLVTTDSSSVIERAMKGDASTLAELRRMLTQPATVELLGNLAKLTEQTLIDNVAGENLAVREGIKCKMQAIRKDLAGLNSTPLEKLLVERVALCWLSLHDAEFRLADFKSLTVTQSDYWQRRMDHVHRRYLSAMKTLATVRKLSLPVVQVNIAKRQTTSRRVQRLCLKSRRKSGHDR